MSSLLKEKRRKREELTATLDLTGGGPPQSFHTMLLGGMGRLLTPHHPFHMAGQSELKNRGAACIGTTASGNWAVSVPDERLVTPR